MILALLEILHVIPFTHLHMTNVQHNEKYRLGEVHVPGILAMCTKLVFCFIHN